LRWPGSLSEPGALTTLSTWAGTTNE
jgi:hypothetical protein